MYAQDRSYIADLIWLSTSSAVDLVLSMVLSLELWWARRKLAAKGGIMAKVTWQLLVSFCISTLDWTRADLVADHFPWWSRSHCSTTHCTIPFRVQKSCSILLSSYTIRMFHLWSSWRTMADIEATEDIHPYPYTIFDITAKPSTRPYPLPCLLPPGSQHQSRSQPHIKRSPQYQPPRKL